jgi:hypothetical protein
MTTDENWIAEQARLVMLEDGFGPGYSGRPAPAGGASASDEVETVASRSPSP